MLIRKIIRCVVVCLATVIGSGCSTTKHQNFNPTVIEPHSSVKLLFSPSNEEIGLQFVPYAGAMAAGAQFGLIGVLAGARLDAGVMGIKSKDSQKKAIPFRKVLADFSIRDEFATSLAAYPLSAAWASEVTVSTEDLPAGGVNENFLQQLNERYLVLINTRYHLKPSLQALEMFTVYSVWDKNLVPANDPEKTFTGKDTKLKPIYSNRLIYQSFPYNADKRLLTQEERADELAAYKRNFPIDESVSARKRKVNQEKIEEFSASLMKQTVPINSYTVDGAVWLENDGELLKQTLIDGFNEISRIIVADLSGDLTLPDSAFQQDNETESYILEASENGRILETFKIGGLISRNKDYPFFTPWD